MMGFWAERRGFLPADSVAQAECGRELGVEHYSGLVWGEGGRYSDLQDLVEEAEAVCQEEGACTQEVKIQH